MRLILLLSSFGTGGAEYSSLKLYSYLESRGHKVLVVALKDVMPRFYPENFQLSNVITLDGNTYWAKFKALRKIVKDFYPQLMHSVLFEANILGRHVRKVNSSFFYIESLVNEMYSHTRYKDLNINWLKLNGYRLFDFITQIIAVDHFHATGISVAEHYQHKLLISENRITIIHRGREANEHIGNLELKEKLKLEFGCADKLLLVNVGRHEFQKGQDILINAISNFSDDIRRKIKLVIVGREGNMTPKLVEKIRNERLEDSIQLLGHRTDVSSILASADIFVFPSRFEGLPGSLIEAEAAGLPIICSDISNNLEVVQPSLNALTFPIQQPKNLEECLIEMIENSNLRVEFGKKSLSIFLDRFQIQNVHKKMESLMENLVLKG